MRNIWYLVDYVEKFYKSDKNRQIINFGMQI